MNLKPKKQNDKNTAFPIMKGLIGTAILFFLMEEIWVRISLHSWLYLAIGAAVFNAFKLLTKRITRKHSIA